MVSDISDLLSDEHCSIDDPEVQQFFADQGRRSAANYIQKHNITRPPKDDAEALKWAREATAEYINDL